MHKYLLNTDFIILNKGTEPTFQDSRRQEVIDITVYTKRMANLVGDWRISNKPSGSDHKQICTFFPLSDQKRGWREIQETDWIGCRTVVATKLNKSPTRFRTKKNLEVNTINNAIMDAYKTNCPEKPKCPKAKVS